MFLIFRPGFICFLFEILQKLFCYVDFILALCHFNPLEMYINFMTNSVTSLRPICVGYKEVQRVGTYKLLGVIISDDLNGTHMLNM